MKTDKLILNQKLTEDSLLVETYARNEEGAWVHAWTWMPKAALQAYEDEYESGKDFINPYFSNEPFED